MEDRKGGEKQATAAGRVEDQAEAEGQKAASGKGLRHWELLVDFAFSWWLWAQRMLEREAGLAEELNSLLSLLVRRPPPKSKWHGWPPLSVEI